jgi:hypothetical protein
MKSLYMYLEDIMATPGNTMGMGNPMPPTDTTLGSEPLVAAKCKKEKCKKSKKIREGLLDRVKNKEVNHDALIKEFLEANYNIWGGYTIDTSEFPFKVSTTGKVFAKIGIPAITNGLFVFDKVGVFEVTYNDNITSLEGAPRECNDFICNGCKSLTSLEGAPEKVGGMFWCVECNSLRTLEGAPRECSDFNCQLCSNLISLEGAPKKVKRDFYCGDCKSLKTLEGAPKRCKSFDCNNCKSLTTLKGVPEQVNTLCCQFNTSLKALDYLPKKITNAIYCYGCASNFDKNDIMSRVEGIKKIHTEFKI